MTAQELASHLYAEAMKLPVKERLKLVMSLSETMGPGIDDDEQSDDEVELSDAMKAELERRIRRFEAGEPGIPLEEFMTRVNASFRQRQ